jgi:hypothetical protein
VKLCRGAKDDERMTGTARVDWSVNGAKTSEAHPVPRKKVIEGAKKPIRSLTPLIIRL